ncbi:MAG: FAD:protein FMN transferase [Spirochaetales bacterium]|nr:FAD:protein FMN transferase [Spirochaetales bacterium]
MNIKTLIVYSCLLCFVSGCGPARFSTTRLAITEESTIPVSIIIYGDQTPDWDKIFKVLASTSRLYDHRIQGSPVNTLNTTHRTKVPDKVYTLLALGLDIAEQSNGAFDITVLPLTRLWNFDNTPRLPSQREISGVLGFVDYTKVSLPEDNRVVIPEKSGIDLGGIAKGAIVDDIADYLESLGYRNFLIEAGGDILVSGLKPPGKQWIVAIIHPRDESTFFGKLAIGKSGKRMAVVTSGDYEQYFERDGKRYHHIIDPHTGYPAENMISVTVIAPTCAEADGLATAVFVLGPEKGLALLEKRKQTEGLLIFNKDGNLESVMTEEFSSLFQRE